MNVQKKKTPNGLWPPLPPSSPRFRILCCKFSRSTTSQNLLNTNYDKNLWSTMTKYDQILPIMTKLMTKIYDQTAHLLNTLNKKLQLFLGFEMTVMFRWVGPLNAPSLRAQVHQSTKDMNLCWHASLRYSCTSLAENILILVGQKKIVTVTKFYMKFLTRRTEVTKAGSNSF